MGQRCCGAGNCKKVARFALLRQAGDASPTVALVERAVGVSNFKGPCPATVRAPGLAREPGGVGEGVVMHVDNGAGWG